MSKTYVPPHMRKSFAGSSPEAQAWIDLEAEQEAQRLLERFAKRDPAFARKLGAKLLAATLPETAESDGE